MRVPAIDCFRGIAIALMIFFTLSLQLGGKPSWLLDHNVPGELHPGDFVLPMFIFASGMSLAFFHRSRQGKKLPEYALDAAERAGKLALAWAFISPLSAGAFFGMDEIMLNILLFIACLFLVRLGDAAAGAVAAGICIGHVALWHLGMLPDFAPYHLGGYAAAPFYLPVMIAGMVAGKRIGRLESLVLPLAAAAALLLLLVPPWKMSASASFMALSALVSLLGFMAVRGLRSVHLERMGARPFRYWVLMFAALLVPLGFYALFSGAEMPFGLGEPLAVAGSAFCVLYVYGVSRLLDRLFPWLAA